MAYKGRHDTTQSWLDLLAAGDDAAWLRFVRERLPAIRRTARRYVRTEEHTNDVAQEVMVKVLVALRKFHLDPTKPGGFWHWCLTVARNTAVSALRHDARAREAGPPGAPDLCPAADVLTEGQVDRLFEAALARLEGEVGPDAFAVYRGKVRDGRKRGEVAAERGLPVAEEDQLKTRAHKRMMAILADLIADWPFGSPGDDRHHTGGAR